MEFYQRNGRIWAEDPQGRLMAEITFPQVRRGVVNFDHTFVDPSLRGQGVAGRLVQTAADQVRQRELKAVLTCSYAKGWFAAHPEQHDLLAEN